MCLFPRYIERNEAYVPCSKCLECKKRRVSNWSFRLLQEEKRSTSAHFITLTYDTTFVPITKNGFMSLSKEAMQRFFKRLRKRHMGEHDSKSIKYYCVGEYGGQTKRPHYHIILFNSEIELIQPSWPYGQIHYGRVEGASVGYTLKYVSKSRWKAMHCNDDRESEFSLMSKGMGANYLTEDMCNWHYADLANRMYVNIGDGKKAAMPRYYKDKLYSVEQRKVLKEHHEKVMSEKQLKVIENQTIEQLYAYDEYKKHSAVLLDKYSTLNHNKI